MVFLNFIGIAIIQTKRELLIKGEFADIMETLQHLNNVEVVTIVHIANQLYRKYIET